MTYSIDSVDCQLPCISHGRRIRAAVRPSETTFPLFDGSGKRWVTVGPEGSLHVIDADVIAGIISPTSTAGLAGKAKESLPASTRAVWGVPKSGAGYVAELSGQPAFVIKTNKCNQSVPGAVLNVVSIGEHGVAVLTTDGRVVVYISESGTVVGPLSLPARATAVASFGEAQSLLVTAGHQLFAFDANGRPLASTVLPTTELGTSSQWAVQDMIAVDGQSLAVCIVQDGPAVGLPDTWTAVFNVAISGGTLNVGLCGFSTNDVFISALKFPSRAYLRWLPEIQVLLVSHSCADAVSLYHRDSGTGRFQCFIMPEGKQLGCALDEATAESTTVRGLFVVPPSPSDRGSTVTLALAQSDGYLAIHTLEFPANWKTSTVAALPSLASSQSNPPFGGFMPSAGGFGGFASVFAQQASTQSTSPFGAFGTKVTTPTGFGAFGAFGANEPSPAASLTPVGGGQSAGPSLFDLATQAVSGSSFGILASGTQTVSGNLFGSTNSGGSLFGSYSGAATSSPAGAAPSTQGALGPRAESLLKPAQPLAGQPLAGQPLAGQPPAAQPLEAQPLAAQPPAAQAATVSSPATLTPEREKPKPAVLPPDPFKLPKMKIPAGFNFEEKKSVAPEPVPLTTGLKSSAGSLADSLPVSLPKISSPMAAGETPPLSEAEKPTVQALLANWKSANAVKAVPGDKELLTILEALEKELAGLENLSYASLTQCPSALDTAKFEGKLGVLRMDGSDLQTLEDECEEMSMSVKPLFFGDESLVESDLVIVGLRDRVAGLEQKIESTLQKAKNRNLKLSTKADWELPSEQEPAIFTKLGISDAIEPQAVPSARTSEYYPSPALAEVGRRGLTIFGKSPLADSTKSDLSLKQLVEKTAANVARQPEASKETFETPWQILRRIDNDAKKISALEKAANKLAISLAEKTTN